MRLLVAWAFLSLLIAIPAFSDELPKYYRNLFGGWSDTDRDCQNMRHELLQKLSTAVVQFSENTCKVTRGDGLIRCCQTNEDSHRIAGAA